MSAIPGATLHPILNSLGAEFSSLLLLPAVACEKINPTTITGNEIDFGTTENYPYNPRGFRVVSAGDVVYRLIGDEADTTETFVANQTVPGILERITKSGSTSTSIVLLY